MENKIGHQRLADASGRDPGPGVVIAGSIRDRAVLLSNNTSTSMYHVSTARDRHGDWPMSPDESRSTLHLVFPTKQYWYPSTATTGSIPDIL
eukprot:2332265-Rhodomonas_salina.2